MKIKLKGYICIILFITGSFLFAQTGGGTKGNGLSRGEALFKENNAKDAVQVLEYEIMNGQISDNTYNFLGLGYYQLGEYEKSLDAFKRGLKAQPDNAKVLSYNIGNTQYALKDYASAASSYSDSMKADPLFYDALLNRANALLMAGQLKSARDDYIDFNTKCPDDPQHERIEMLIKALEEEIARREEEARLLAEQNKAQWEEYDGNLADSRNTSFTPDWEEVETYLADGSKDQEKAEWERINREDPGAVADKNDSEKLASDKEDNSSEYWEEFEHEKAGVSEAAKEEPVKEEKTTYTPQTTSYRPPSYNTSQAAPSRPSYSQQTQAPKRTPAPSRSSQSNLVSFDGGQDKRSKYTPSSEVYVIKPVEIDDAQTVVDFLKKNRAIVINMEGLALDPAQRIIDFIGGACYGINGELKAISSNIFIAVPNSMEVSGDLREEILTSPNLSE